MSTIRDVAREAGVGVGTVSRVLSGGARVAPATRARVEAAILKLDYHPSPAARALSRRRTHTLEVVVPLATRHFYVEVLRGIEEALAETDYAVVIRTIDRPAARDRALAALGQRGRADGVIVVSLAPTDSLLAQLAAARVPAVLVDALHPTLPSVYVDHQAAAMAATRHLLAEGHQRIAIVDQDEDPAMPAAVSERQRGYRMALEAAGIPWKSEYEMVREPDPEGGMAAAAALLALPEPPTAVFVGSDIQAVGVLQEARRGGRRVPRDLAIAGYGDIEMSHHIGLTTMRVPVRELGQRGVELLLEAISGSAAPRQVQLPAELIVRRTTAPPGRQTSDDVPWPDISPD